MTNPDKPGIVRKLTRKRAVLHDADRLHTTLDLVNPDGPEAAAIIAALVEALGDFARRRCECVGNEGAEAGCCATCRARAAVAKVTA